MSAVCCVVLFGSPFFVAYASGAPVLASVRESEGKTLFFCFFHATFLFSLAVFLVSGG